jgi:hypothetical protein
MKFEVWYREGGEWKNCDEGPLTRRVADRIAAEIKSECRLPTRVAPAGCDPNLKDLWKM